MELFALKSFLLILVLVLVPRSFVKIGESYLHPEKMNTIFPSKPWTTAQISDLHAFLRSPKLDLKSNGKNSKLQGSKDAGRTQEASHRPTAPSAGHKPKQHQRWLCCLSSSLPTHYTLCSQDKYPHLSSLFLYHQGPRTEFFVLLSHIFNFISL